MREVKHLNEEIVEVIKELKPINNELLNKLEGVNNMRKETNIAERNKTKLSDSHIKVLFVGDCNRRLFLPELPVVEETGA